MLLDYSNDPVMVQKHVIDSDDDLAGKEAIEYPKSGGSISEYDSTSSDGEDHLSQSSECDTKLHKSSSSGLITTNNVTNVTLIKTEDIRMLNHLVTIYLQHRQSAS